MSNFAQSLTFYIAMHASRFASNTACSLHSSHVTPPWFRTKTLRMKDSFQIVVEFFKQFCVLLFGNPVLQKFNQTRYLAMNLFKTFCVPAPPVGAGVCVPAPPVAAGVHTSPVEMSILKKSNESGKKKFPLKQYNTCILRKRATIPDFLHRHARVAIVVIYCLFLALIARYSALVQDKNIENERENGLIFCTQIFVPLLQNLNLKQMHKRHGTLRSIVFKTFCVPASGMQAIQGKLE